MERRCVLNSWTKEEVRVVIRYEWARGVSGTEIHNRLVEVYGPGVMSKQMVRRWCRTFSDGRQQVEDIPRAGRTRTATTDANVGKVDDMIRANRRITIDEVAEELGISHERAQNITQDILRYRTVSARWPLLMQRFKFDLRLYVLLTSVSPLRIYIYKKGLVRLATIPYKKPNASNMHEKRMHLTNYAVNKRIGEGNIELLKDENCKKSLRDLDELLTSSSISAPKLWGKIDGIIVKTIISALPTLQRLFQMAFPISTPIPSCFELLGFDILLAKSGKPYLLEVNRSPSLGASTLFDKEMKRNLIKDILNMTLLTPRQINLIIQEEHRKAIHRLTNPSMTKKLTAKESILTEYLEKKEIRMMGNFRKLYPVEDDRYDEIHRMSFSLDSRNMNESKTIQNRRTKEKE
ncbi:tubulin polyglutamylase ttll6 [Trichonephila inaurata madagascariensis]|uniref:Tubulin polyglutamylase ttll6 n=1 Tax=Trichonephila inaurata madagascariensis TaxID=2747483 RepID=A0A8X6X0H8_9ARAC|nr:tubulin polyglutamylase ttll6 [Trichonephila inaurata madagascariensis]